MPNPTTLTDYTAPPERNQVEVTIFGPGYGESIVVHIGGGNWIIIDSCIEKQTGLPAPLHYFQSIGVEPAKAVKLIVASHWHDDHVRGLAKIVDECTGADFVCSVAMRDPEFLTYVGLHDRLNFRRATSGVQEIKKVRLTLGGRVPKKAQENRRLLLVPADETGLGAPCEIWSLSPSDLQIEKFLNEIAMRIPVDLASMTRATSEPPNHVAVVIWIDVGECKILLGSDLEETGGGTGWSAIVASSARPSGKAEIFKVPHHGSLTAHNPDVWNDMTVDQNPLSLLTPFSLGNVKLPTSGDATRILRYTNAAFVTTNVMRKRSEKRPPTVQKTIREVVGQIGPSVPDFGVVRVRSRQGEASGPWSIEQFGGAVHLSEVA